MVTIKVPADLRDRLVEQARSEQMTVAGVIARSLELAETAAFWDEVRETMCTTQGLADVRVEVERYDTSASDGLEPDEDWSDIL